MSLRIPMVQLCGIRETCKILLARPRYFQLALPPSIFLWRGQMVWTKCKCPRGMIGLSAYCPQCRNIVNFAKVGGSGRCLLCGFEDLKLAQSYSPAASLPRDSL